MEDFAGGEGSRRKKLTWEDYPEIAERLAETHEGVDFLNITDEELAEMVNALPEFCDTPVPGNSDLYGAILTVWTRIASDDGGYYDGQYDAYV